MFSFLSKRSARITHGMFPHEKVRSGKLPLVRFLLASVMHKENVMVSALSYNIQIHP